jgi:hypothetical protein
MRDIAIRHAGQLVADGDLLGIVGGELTDVIRQRASDVATLVLREARSVLVGVVHIIPLSVGLKKFSIDHPEKGPADIRLRCDGKGHPAPMGA